MRFTPTVATLLLASLAAASPVARVQARQSTDLCHAGVPCRIQMEINDALGYINQAVADTGAAQVVAQVQSTGAQLLATATELAGDITGLSASASAQLVAYVYADVSPLVGEIKTSLAAVVKANSDASAALSAAESEVTTGVANIEAIIGYCPPSN